VKVKKRTAGIEVAGRRRGRKMMTWTRAISSQVGRQPSTGYHHSAIMKSGKGSFYCNGYKRIIELV